MNWKKPLIFCSVGFGALVIIVVVSGFFLFRYVARFSPEKMLPEELKNPGVLAGADFVSREIFFEDARLKNITDIVEGELDSLPGPELGVAGTGGAVLLDEHGAVKSSVLFRERAGHVVFIDLESDNTCEYMDRGGGWQDVSVIDHAGNTLWTYGGFPGVNSMASGDVDADGMLEFAAGFNGAGGVRLLDHRGSELWKEKGSNVWHVEMVDTNGDGNLEIVHSNAGGEIVVRNAEGQELRRARPPAYFAHFSLCAWPTRNDKKHALLAQDEMVWLFDFDGTAVGKFPAPNSGKFGEAKGISVKLTKGQPEYLAVLVDFRLQHRAVLYLYDSSNLVYHEILPESSAAIAALHLDDSDVDSLLVGGEGAVWRYAASAGSDSNH